MGWSIGYDSRWQRDIGYGVPAFCDHPQCHEEIDRGLSYVCGGEPYGGGDKGCGLYFCGAHLLGGTVAQRCSRCRHRKAPFAAKPDHPKWLHHKATDDSWAEWRKEQATNGSGLQAQDATTGQACTTTADKENEP